MNKKTKIGLLVALFLIVSAGLAMYLANHTVSVLQPAGLIAREQKDLIVTSILLMLIIVIPVYILAFFIAWKYRSTNKKARYSPDWDHNNALEALWWGIPLILIIVLSVMAWNSSHALDPFKPIESHKKTLTVQVIALQWRWLFIYPEQNIASVNKAFIPIDTPVNFEITSDAPMNAFWVPQLGGQIYAMSGMSTHLYLIADKPGSYNGSSANISGQGFSDMKFIVTAGSSKQFNDWVVHAKNAALPLNLSTYYELAKPLRNPAGLYFSSVQGGLYDRVVLKYLMPKDQLPALGASSHSHQSEVSQ